jgi:2-oxoglutarate dehydrogenase E1 component
MTTPAQIFHALRRQVKREFRKPLIVMSPKSLLRHPRVVSPIEAFTQGGFQEVIADETTSSSASAKAVTRVILCSGKVYYDLLARREEMAKTDPKSAARFALVRVEQLYPWPEHRLAPIFDSYPNLEEVVWCQEEPKNMGAWFFVAPRLQEMLEVPVRYAGRDERASPATGSEKRHQEEQKALVEMAYASWTNTKTKSAQANASRKK